MINEIILTITNFLQINIIDNHIIILDMWSIVHIISGLLIMLFLIKQRQKAPFVILLAALILWELFEFTNYQILENTFFAKEKTVDIVWDILVGIGGGSLGKFLTNSN